MKLHTRISLLLILILAFESCKSARVPEPSRPEQPSIRTDQPGPISTYPIRTSPITKSSEFYNVLDVPVAPSPREFRGVWIATVANIDWPTSSIAPFERQKEEFTKLLDYYKSLNFNAVIVQIRTAGDAFYPSEYAPWSRYLTGREGNKPNTPEDPLAWMIQEAHRRGLEFHAWMNPYRATMSLDTKILSAEHDYNKHRDWMIKYDTKYYYDPGRPEVKEHLVKIIKEVVQKYPIDAIHFDDYFYPYKVKNVSFGDAASFKKYGKPGQSLDDWRRDNVTQLIIEANNAIKSEKPWVQFGISPFGVWRNKDKDPSGSNTRAGQTNYDELYADVILWMQNKYIDYLIPQLYWSMDFNVASHRELVAWWSKNSYDTKIYIGNGPYKVRDNFDKAWDNPMEIPNQVGLSKITPNIDGNAYFSAKSMYIKNRDIAELLHKNHYATPAITPDAIREGYLYPPVFYPVLTTLSDGLAFRFDQLIETHYRYALVYSASSLIDLQEKNGACAFQKIYLDESNRKLLPLLEVSNHKFIAFTLLDVYGKETRPMIFEIKGKPTLQ